MFQLLLVLLLQSTVVNPIEHQPMLMLWPLKKSKLTIKMPPLELNIKSRMLKTTLPIDNGSTRTKPETGLNLNLQTLPEALLNQVFLTLLLLLLNNKLTWLHLMLILLKHRLITLLLLKPRRMELLPQELIKFKVVPKPLKTPEDGDSSGQSLLFLNNKDLQKTLIKLKNKLSKRPLR